MPCSHPLFIASLLWNKLRLTHKSLLFIFLFLVSAISLSSQTPPLDSDAQVELKQKIETMQNILQSITLLELEIAEKEKELKEADSQESENIISEEIKQLHERNQNLDKDFAILSAGIDQEQFFQQEEEELNWEDEVKDIFSPFISELKAITARPREIERLKSTIPNLERRVEQIALALANIDTLQSSVTDSSIQENLTVLSEFWDNHQQEHDSELQTMKLQLEKLEKEKKNLGEAAGEVLKNFFKSRGKNLILAIFIFIMTFFSLRYLYKFIRRYTDRSRSPKRRFFARLVDVLYYLFTLLASIGLFLAVLFLASDWVLLGLSVILLLGLLWAGKNALPTFFEQVKLLLNVGAVREGERIIYQGVPWRVKSLNIYTVLSNPELESGHIRLPLKDLLGLRSRPYSESEVWFPSTKGDWVILADGFYGKVFAQTPESVGIETQRGSLKTYLIKDFLSNKPQNLSRNFFSVNRTIEIDFKYRNKVNLEITPAIKSFFQEAIQKEPYGHFVEQIIVELSEIKASSLGIICIIKFKGGAASEYFEIGWKIEQIAIEALNQLNIDIPYPHLAIQNGIQIE